MVLHTCSDFLLSLFEGRTDSSQKFEQPRQKPKAYHRFCCHLHLLDNFVVSWVHLRCHSLIDLSFSAWRQQISEPAQIRGVGGVPNYALRNADVVLFYKPCYIYFHLSPISTTAQNHLFTHHPKSIIINWKWQQNRETFPNKKELFLGVLPCKVHTWHLLKIILDVKLLNCTWIYFLRYRDSSSRSFFLKNIYFENDSQLLNFRSFPIWYNTLWVDRLIFTYI